MRVVVTRPRSDGERTADRLRARGHQVLLAPLMRVEPVAADLSGSWTAVIITSANVPDSIRDNPARGSLLALPVYAVGRRSAQAAQAAGFADVTAGGGDVRDLVQLIAGRHADAAATLLYLAGEDRAADVLGELAAHRIRAEMRVVYRAVTAPFPSELAAALEAGDVEGVLHFSRRSADNYVAGARAADITPSALEVRHYCLSRQVAEPLLTAGARQVFVSAHPDEASLIELLPPSPG
jgi:uroporphyrinogen-III synthase